MSMSDGSVSFYLIILFLFLGLYRKKLSLPQKKKLPHRIRQQLFIYNFEIHEYYIAFVDTEIQIKVMTLTDVEINIKISRNCFETLFPKHIFPQLPQVFGKSLQLPNSEFIRHTKHPQFIFYNGTL